ncbi:MAG: UDP-N-acetylmuramate--L-alanine ligase, partial [Chitinophagia bacterium]|nr:UDP-N-acetylmuramate--L-alanine ligase [Chitinophagia bacterium]
IVSAKRLYPERQCVVCFQPHLFTRTRDLADGFAHSLSMADEVLLMPIYPARELPLPGVTTAMIAERMTGHMPQILNHEQLLGWIAEHKPALLITAGAGDIDKLVTPIKNLLQN